MRVTRILLNPLKSPTRRVLSGGRHFTLLPRSRGYTSGDSAPPKRSSHSNWKTVLKIRGALILGALGVYYVSHLEKVSETGRWRFMDTSLEYEAQLAETSRRKYRAEFEHATLPTTHPLSKHVRRVVSRILSASNLGVVRGDSSSDDPVSMLPFVQGRDGYPSNSSDNTLRSTVKWDVIVVNSRRINAFSTPGLIVVFTGILPICRDEEGLAAVLAHEIGHIVARHLAESLSSPKLIYHALLQLVRSPSDTDSADGPRPPNSEVQEHEADLIGLRLMSKACYNPQSVLDMLSRMAHLESKIPPNRNSTFPHLSSVSRAKSIEEYIPEGYAIMATNPDCDHVRRQLERFDDMYAITIDKI